MQAPTIRFRMETLKDLNKQDDNCTAVGPAYDWQGEKNAMLSGTGCRQKGMSSPEEAAEWPALSYSTKITGANLEELCQGKPERKDSLTHAGLYLL